MNELWYSPAKIGVEQVLGINISLDSLKKERKGVASSRHGYAHVDTEYPIGISSYECRAEGKLSRG